VQLPEPAEQQAAGQPATVVAKGMVGARRPTQLSYSAPTVDGGGGVVRRSEAATDEPDGDLEYAGTARNAACPCGSGRKYKRCHGDPKARARMQQQASSS
jgi:preprotein translocase subunit SecA